MSKFTVYEPNTGEIKFVLEGEEAVARLNGAYIPGGYPPEEYVIIGGAPHPKRKKAEEEREVRRRELATQLDSLLYKPCNGFDADPRSRERINGMITRLQRGDGFPPGWVGWRDHNNQQHWAEDDAATVLANLSALSRAIEDREQALLVASWQHKASIAALTDIDEIIGYDVTANWPT